MKIHLLPSAFIPVAFLAFVTAAAQPREGSRTHVWILGSSNVADWSCRASNFEARVDSGRVRVRVEAHDLKCGNGRMDRDLYAALKASDIVAVFAPQATGTVAVAGVERSVAADVTMERTREGSLRAYGSVPLRMTDFGIKPPVGLFGLIRSRNEIVVKFDLVLPPASEPES